RKSHAFYQLQAQHRNNFEQLEKMLQAQLQRKAKLVIETLAGISGPDASASLMEKEKQARVQAEGEKRKQFLEHAIVRDTKEIFGAELYGVKKEKSKYGGEKMTKRGGGFGGGMGNMQQLMQQAKQRQAKMEAMQADLASKTAEASAGGGAVRAVVNGKNELL